MSDTQLQIPVNQQTPNIKTLKPKKIDKLPPEQRVWSANVLKALGLQPRSSQNRIMAGAIASAEMVEQTGSAGEKLLARYLREKVIKAGKPPWETDVAMEMGATKIELDLLSIPQGQRQLRPLGGNQGVNQAFWIDRTDADTQERHSFLCKPAGTPGGMNPLAPSGGTKGGEVAREALSSRAAHWLAGNAGIDVGMPETHVVELDSGLMGLPSGTKKTCSVQEARNAPGGDLRSATPNTRQLLDPRQVAGIAIFDTLTLNTDRHSGNILLGANNELVPIDHGESFAERNDDGVERLGASMGGPHNALLALPGAHDPMPGDMLKKLKSLDPKSYAKTLTGDRQVISGKHPSMDGMVTDGAIEMARRSARFLQLAAKAEPPMSPAAIQVAMGNSAKLLFAPDVDEQTFEQNARIAIDRMAGQGETVKAVCTCDNAVWEKLSERATALGWQVARRSGEPSGDAIADPVMLLKIVKERIQAPNNRGQRERKIAELLQGGMNPQTAMDTMLEIKLAALEGAIRLLPQQQQQVFARRKQAALSPKLSPAQQIREIDNSIQSAVDTAVQIMTQQLNQWQVQSRINDIVTNQLVPYNLDAYSNALGFINAKSPEQAKPLYDLVGIHIGQNKYINDASADMVRRLNNTADAMQIGPGDQDLRDGLQAATAGDPFTAFQKLRLLKVRPNPCANILTLINKLLQEYVVDPNDDYLKAAQQAVQAGDAEKASIAYEQFSTRVTESGTPNAQRMTKTATALGVPNNDNDLMAALQAVNGNDARTAGNSWRAVLRRAQAGEFGQQGAQDLLQRLNQLKQDYEIPPGHPALRRAQDGLDSNNPAKAIFNVERLEELAGANMFVEK